MKRIFMIIIGGIITFFVPFVQAYLTNGLLTKNGKVNWLNLVKSPLFWIFLIIWLVSCLLTSGTSEDKKDKKNTIRGNINGNVQQDVTNNYYISDSAAPIRKSSIKPYLSAYQDIIKPEDIFGDNDRFFEVCNEKVATMRYSVELQKVKDIYRKQEDTYSLKYCVRNEGAGNAVSMMIKINDYNVETGLIKGEKMNLYLKIKLDDKSDKKYHFLFTYWDVEHLCCYTQENTLVFTWNNEDMDWEFKPLQLSKPKLIDEEK